jgi:hypothetical protein
MNQAIDHVARTSHLTFGNEIGPLLGDFRLAVALHAEGDTDEAACTSDGVHCGLAGEVHLNRAVVKPTALQDAVGLSICRP